MYVRSEADDMASLVWKTKPISSEETVRAAVREGSLGCSPGGRSETTGGGGRICETGRF